MGTSRKMSDHEGHSVPRASTRPARAAFVVNTDRAFVTHRSAWATELVSQGYEVHVYAPDSGYGEEISQLGFIFHNLDLGRENISPKIGLLAAWSLFRALISTRPRIVFLVQTAAYTLGWPAAVLLWRSRFIRVAGGMGRALGPKAEESSRSARIVRSSLRISSRLPNVWTLFQLEGDRKRFLSHKLAAKSRSWVVPGTGVDLGQWRARESDRSSHQLTVGFASRLYAEKGIYEFAEAARILSSDSLRFVVVGAPDTGVSTSVPVETLAEWTEDGRLEWWGHQDRMDLVFPQLDLLVFPSRHPEGTPRTLIEAAASGVPVIASDQEGCRAVVADNESGWILPSTSVEVIVEAIRAATADRDALTAAGRRAREVAVAQFSLEGTVRRVLDGAGINSATRTTLTSTEVTA